MGLDDLGSDCKGGQSDGLVSGSRSGPSYQQDQACFDVVADLKPSVLMDGSGAEKSGEFGRNEAQELDGTHLKAY